MYGLSDFVSVVIIAATLVVRYYPRDCYWCTLIELPNALLADHGPVA